MAAISREGFAGFFGMRGLLSQIDTLLVERNARCWQTAPVPIGNQPMETMVETMGSETMGSGLVFCPLRPRNQPTDAGDREVEPWQWRSWSGHFPCAPGTGLPRGNHRCSATGLGCAWYGAAPWGSRARSFASVRPSRNTLPGSLDAEILQHAHARRNISGGFFYTLGGRHKSAVGSGRSESVRRRSKL